MFAPIPSASDRTATAVTTGVADERANGEAEILHHGLRPEFYDGTTPI